MKKKSIKMSILIPAMSTLVAGITVMIVIVANHSSPAVNDLPTQLIDARANECVNEFSRLNSAACGSAIYLTAAIQTVMADSTILVRIFLIIFPPL